MRELTPLAVVLGIIIGALFGAANALIGLKVGIVISASIPAAVISMGVLRGILKRGTILENNMVQTVASSGESLAAGMIFTIPALYIFGFNPQLIEMVMWGGIGGLLGVLFMVPLRRVLIVKEHGKLPFPEGVACAEVLESGDRGGGGAKTVFWGVGVGAIYELFRSLGFWPTKAQLAIPQIHSAASLNASPALLGVGYILGARIAGYMLAGAVLGWFVIIPAIAFFGAGATAPIFPETEKIISDMSPKDLWEKYLRYVGAGAVVLGGLISLIRSAPTIASSMWSVASGVLDRSRVSNERTNRDLPLPLLLLLLVGLAYAMFSIDAIKVNAVGAIAVLVFGFFFVTVSSRLAGLVGNSSNPASGMTIATLLGTSLLFTYGLGLTDDTAKYACLSVGALVCTAICIAGDCSQDLKTGFLVRATPWKQQVGELIGVLTMVIVIAWVIQAVNSTYGYVETPENPHPVLAPQANIMKLLVEGVMDGSLPWVLIISGMGAALVIELLGVPVLPVAVGLYLPLHISMPIMVGGLIRWGVNRRRKPSESGDNPGILGASGLVAGEGLVGVIMVGAAAFIGSMWNDPFYANPLTGLTERVLPHHFVPWLSEKIGIAQQYGYGEFGYNLFPLAPFMVLMLWLAFTAMKKTPPPRTGLPIQPTPLPEEFAAAPREADKTIPFELSSSDEVVGGSRGDESPDVKPPPNDVQPDS